jgi:hypothetical protein
MRAFERMFARLSGFDTGGLRDEWTAQSAKQTDHNRRLIDRPWAFSE